MPNETGVFLEKRSYRRRRLLDAQRALPVIGAWLFLLPVIWPGRDEVDAPSMSAALSYVFGVWVALILMTCG